MTTDTFMAAIGTGMLYYREGYGMSKDDRRHVSRSGREMLNSNRIDSAFIFNHVADKL